MKRIQKNKKTPDIYYVSQNQVTNLISERSAFARWCNVEELRLIACKKPQDFDKTFTQFKQERESRKAALNPLARLAEIEKRQTRQHWPDSSQKLGPMETIRVQFPLSPQAFLSETEIPPSKTFIYSGGPYNISNLIYPCPDKRNWSSWFQDNEVTLNQGYRFWYPSSILHPIRKNFLFTGRSIIDTRFSLQGVVDIGSYGSVTVDIATYETVVRCTAADKNHDSGWHSDPQYDTILCNWISYCDGNQPRIFTDNQPGLHTFPFYIDLPFRVFISNCRGSDHFVEVTHIVTITAVNADCQFGPNVQDCASGSTFGWIKTQWPIVSLEYVPLVARS